MPFLPLPATLTVGPMASGALLPISMPAMAQKDETWAAQIGIVALDISFDASWLSVVEQRIKASVAPDGYTQEGAGAWLRANVGSAAVDFFRSTSTVLPGEPYLYASNAGDLVAEFMGPCGKMTCIIAPNAVYVFAVAGDEILEKKFDASDAGELRSQLQLMTNLLRPARQNATLGSR